MRAKYIHEYQEFQRGKDTKKALDVGFKSERWLKNRLKQEGIDYNDFYYFYLGGFEEWGSEDISSYVDEILEHTSPDYQIRFWEEEIDNFKEIHKDLL